MQNAQQTDIVQAGNTAQVMNVVLQMNVILTVTVRVINANVTLEAANMTQTTVLLTVTVQDLIKNVALGVAETKENTQDRAACFWVCHVRSSLGTGSTAAFKFPPIKPFGFDNIRFLFVLSQNKLK